MGININYIRSDEIYRKIATAKKEQKNDIYRYELMKPFEKKWSCYNIPLKSSTPNGYDIIIASDMLGFLLPMDIDKNTMNNINLIANNNLWNKCKKSIEKSLNYFTSKNIELNITDYTFTILLANPNNPYTIMNEGYCGDGGIPGYIISWLTPNEYTINRLPTCIAHEVNHNIRFQFIKWRNDITLGEMLVSEGLAENFATTLYGIENVGPWVSKTDINELNEYIKPVIKEGLETQGLAEMNAYLYGDEMAALQGYNPVGLPYCAGYACGYYLVKHFLDKTGIDIADATIMPTKKILEKASDFWDIATPNIF